MSFFPNTTLSGKGRNFEEKEDVILPQNNYTARKKLSLQCHGLRCNTKALSDYMYRVRINAMFKLKTTIAAGLNTV